MKIIPTSERDVAPGKAYLLRLVRREKLWGVVRFALDELAELEPRENILAAIQWYLEIPDECRRADP